MEGGGGSIDHDVTSSPQWHDMRMHNNLEGPHLQVFGIPHVWPPHMPSHSPLRPGGVRHCNVEVEASASFFLFQNKISCGEILRNWATDSRVVWFIRPLFFFHDLVEEEFNPTRARARAVGHFFLRATGRSRGGKRAERFCGEGMWAGWGRRSELRKVYSTLL